MPLQTISSILLSSMTKTATFVGFDRWKDPLVVPKSARQVDHRFKYNKWFKVLTDD